MSVELSATADGTRIAIRAQHRAGRSEIVGPHGGALRVCPRRGPGPA